MVYYRPQTKFAKVMFLQVSVCPHGGACVVAPGGEVCVVAAGGGHAWLLRGVHGCSWGGHASLLLGGVCGCSQGVKHVWLLQGGVRGCCRGGACMGYNEIRSISGRYASYWNAFLFSEGPDTFSPQNLILNKAIHEVNFGFKCKIY